MTNQAIPVEAVEAAHAAICEQNLNDCLDPDWRGKCFKAVEAAAPHMLAPSPVVTDEMVDAVLEHDGTPRRRLFEYPRRADDSRDMIRSAETLVRGILRLSLPLIQARIDRAA